MITRMNRAYATLRRRLALEDPASQQLLWMLLGADLLFLFLHVMLLQGHLTDVRFSVEKDRGFAEVFQYVKQYWIFLVFGWMAAQRREPHYAVWSILFGYLLVDDWFMLHERAGAVLAGRLQLPAILRLRARDLGELLFMGSVGILFVSGFVLTYMRAGAATLRAGRRAAVLLAALVGFGVAVDILHQTSHGTILYNSIGTVEDGGEMLVMSLICAYAFSLQLAESVKDDETVIASRSAER